MVELDYDLQKDIDDIAQISIIPTILNVVCQTTGMGFAAVARVTEDRWITCSSRDDLGFGLKPGDELEIKSTICNEIRQTGNAVVIDHVKEDALFCNHHTPAKYGFESYISMPIKRKDGSFFGTLCAIDPLPRDVSSSTITSMFSLFADLISFHLNALQTVQVSESRLVEEKAFNTMLENKVKERTRELAENNVTLEKMNKELTSFTYISNHDLQEPLRKIQTIASVIEEKESHNLSVKGKDYFRRMQNAAGRMQTLINDFLAYSKTSIDEKNYENTSLNDILDEIIGDVKKSTETKFTIKADNMCKADIIPFQFKQLIHNLISNSIKFSNPQIPLLITINSKIGTGKEFSIPELKDTISYCHISFSDNGIGFEQEYSQKIFDIFQRLHDNAKYPGTGIGLSIVKKIVDNHNGIITASGKPGKGAVFNIYIPLL